MRKVKVGTSPAGRGGEGRWRSTLPPWSSAISDRTLSSRAQTPPPNLVRTPRVEARSLLLFLATFSAIASAFDEIHGYGGFAEASSGMAKSRKASDSKLDYSDIMVTQILKLVQKALKGESV